MIRINLAKANDFMGSLGTQTAMRLDNKSFKLEEGQAVKFVLMFIFVLILIGYEKYNLSGIQAKEVAAKAQLTAIDSEINQYGSVTTVIEDLVVEKEKLAERLKVVEKISSKRAFKLNAILKVQESLPEDLWLKELSVENGVINFLGYSRSPSSVQKIVETLGELDFVESAYNKELVKMKLGDSDVQKFDIEAKVKR